MKKKKKSAADLILKKIRESKSEKEEILKVEEKQLEEETSEVEENEEVVETVAEISEIDNSEEDSNEDELTEEEESSEIEEEIEVDEIDYTTLSQEEIVVQLKMLLEKYDVQKIKDHVENIKVYFYKKHHAEIDEKKKAFIENGGLEEEFTPPQSPAEEEFKAYYSVYKEQRASFNVNLEKRKR